MKTVSGKASLSKTAKQLLSSRETAREMIKGVIEMQSSTKQRSKLIKNGVSLVTERPVAAAKG